MIPVCPSPAAKTGPTGGPWNFSGSAGEEAWSDGMDRGIYLF